MRRVLWWILVMAGVGGSLVGCSQGWREQRAAWRGEAERACLRERRLTETDGLRLSRELAGPGVCGADHPIKLRAFATDLALSAKVAGLDPAALAAEPRVTVRFNQEGTLTCPMVAGLKDWMAQVVQPAALARLGQPVVELRTMGTYACRTMNHRAGARLSEHAFANAIDIGGFRLANGEVITLARHWNGAHEEVRHFLREVHAGACRYFSTVLAPGYNALHYDHFHFDMARHGRGGNRSVCRPAPQTVPPPADRPLVNPAQDMIARRNAPVPGAPSATALAETRLPPGRIGDGSAFRERFPQLAQGPATPRPPNLPAIPRRPVAAAEPVLLYGAGRGPFLPLREDEIGPEDDDPITGSIGE